MLPFVLAFGPTAIALGLAWREGEGALGRLLRMAITSPSDHRWFLLVALPVAWALATVGVAVALGGETSGLFDSVVPAVFIVPFVVLVPAFAEEIAWRGYAVSRLLPSMSPLAAAVVLAVPWAALHLFLQLPGQINAGVAVWPTLLALVAYSIVLTWIFVGTGGSVLVTALVHAGLNGVVPLDERRRHGPCVGDPGCPRCCHRGRRHRPGWFRASAGDIPRIARSHLIDHRPRGKETPMRTSPIAIDR